jgi:hypothetical protein
MRLRNNIESLLDQLQDRVPDSTDDLLHALGLQRRRSIAAVILPAVGTLVVGAAIGSALGMLFGPRYGYQLMDRMGVRIPEGLREGATGVTSTGETTRTATSNNAAVSSLRTRSDIHS